MMPQVEVECEKAQVTGRRGNGPGGRRLAYGEMVALSGQQSARLGELYGEYGDRLIRYAHRKLCMRGIRPSEAGALAEDIAQAAWVAVARYDGKTLLESKLSGDDAVLPFLFVRVKQQIGEYMRRPMVTEEPVDWQDPQVCAALCPSLPSGCANAVGLPGRLGAMVAALPEEERAVLLLKLDGVPLARIAEHVGCGETHVRRRLEAAVLLLQIDNPELSGPAVAMESLPRWEREALGQVSADQREALLRLGDDVRRGLLVKLTGMHGEPGATVRVPPKCVAAMSARGGKGYVTGQGGKAPGMRFVDVLRREVAGLVPGDLLPLKAELTARYGIVGRTVETACAVLRSEGLIEPCERAWRQPQRYVVTEAVARLAARGDQPRASGGDGGWAQTVREAVAAEVAAGRRFALADLVKRHGLRAPDAPQYWTHVLVALRREGVIEHAGWTNVHGLRQAVYAGAAAAEQERPRAVAGAVAA